MNVTKSYIRDKKGVLTIAHAAESIEHGEQRHPAVVALAGDIEDAEGGQQHHDGLAQHQAELSGQVGEQNLRGGDACTKINHKIVLKNEKIERQSIKNN